MNYNNTDNLQRYVGKLFYQYYNEVQVLMLLGGEAGEHFFLCKYLWTDYVYCAHPEDVVCNFDDNLNPIKEMKFD